MIKLCTLCNQPIKTGEKLAVLMVAEVVMKEDSYDLVLAKQTILGHFVCPVLEDKSE